MQRVRKTYPRDIILEETGALTTNRRLRLAAQGRHNTRLSKQNKPSQPKQRHGYRHFRVLRVHLLLL
jgi:hypothetical protein